jgi:hypothetical protein
VEDIKLAFETIIVGLMAIPWLLILLHVLLYVTTKIHLLSKVKVFLQNSEQSFALIGTLILGLAYCFGTIIFPLADKLFNRDHNILGIRIKEDSDIRSDVLAKIYFDDELYKLSPEDFPAALGLPVDLEERIRPDALKLLAINKKEGDIDPSREKKGLYKMLEKPFHTIYNYQKYADFNSGGNYEVLKSLQSRIVVLRGAVLNGLCFLVGLILLVLSILLEMLYRLWKKLPVRDKQRRFALSLILLILISTLTWAFCWYGAWGVTEAEKEYDKHVVGLFYGRKAGDASQKPAGQDSEPNTNQQSMQTPVKLQALPLPESSGAVNIGNDRLMVIADEGYDVRIVSNAGATFKAGDAKSFESNMKPAVANVTLRDDKKRVNDLEDVAWDDKRQAAFIVTSHSLNTSQEEKPNRYKLARLAFENGKMEASNLEVDTLKEALRKSFPFIVEAMKRPHEAGGNAGTFNIEGLAFDPRTGFLHIGLRSPTQAANNNACAIVLTLKNPHEIFDKGKPAPPEFDTRLNCLNLGGLGIRGMTYDDERKGYWIVAGRSDDPDIKTNPKPVPSSLWFWDSTKPDQPPQKAPIDTFGLVNIEAVSLLKIDGKQGLLLISDDGDEKENALSRYLWIPVP